jgi:hypothetical protein
VAGYLRNESTDELARQVRQILYYQLKGPESETNRIKTCRCQMIKLQGMKIRRDLEEIKVKKVKKICDFFLVKCKTDSLCQP